MAKTYDAIVVGARCAGSPLAMLLARSGYDVLAVDRATFPSDTISTHLLHAPGVAALERWGLLDDLVATGCPPIEKYTFDFGPLMLSGRSRPVNGVSTAYGPRRTVLDKLLVDAAATAGAEVREAFTVEELVIEDGIVRGIKGHSAGGRSNVERARVVVGADGLHSIVAKAVRPEQYNEKPRLLAGYYTYWSGLPTDGFEVYIRPYRGTGVIPTNDDLTLVICGWPYSEFENNRSDVEGNYMKTLALTPELADRISSAKREARFVGMGVPNFFRKPYGPGWALVGDAGYNKDPITAQGITDAFRDTERLAVALDEFLSGAREFDVALAGYHAERDEHVLPMYEFTTQLATLEPPPPEMQELFGAMAGNQEAMDGFVSVQAGAMSPAEFLAPENVGRIMARAGAVTARS